LISQGCQLRIKKAGDEQQDDEAVDELPAEVAVDEAKQEESGVTFPFETEGPERGIDSVSERRIGEYARELKIDADQRAGLEILEEHRMSEIGCDRKGGNKGADDAGGHQDSGNGGGVKPHDTFPKPVNTAGAVIQGLRDKESAEEKEGWHGDLATVQEVFGGPVNRILLAITMGQNDQQRAEKAERFEIVVGRAGKMRRKMR